MWLGGSNKIINPPAPSNVMLEGAFYSAQLGCKGTVEGRAAPPGMARHPKQRLPWRGPVAAPVPPPHKTMEASAQLNSALPYPS